MKNRFAIFSIAALVAILLNGGMRVLNVWLSPTGRVLDAVNTGIWVVQVGIVIILILSFVFQLTNNQDIDERLIMLYSVMAVYVAVGLISFPIGYALADPIQDRGYEAFIEENRFLIEGIEAYMADHDSPPDSLEALVPAYLDPSIAAIGDQGIELSPTYNSLDRRSGEDVLYSYSPPEEDDPWEMQVSIYLGSFQSTRFVYRPDENYSSRYRVLSGWGLDE